MSAGAWGYLAGTFFISLFFAAIILIVLKLVPFTKQQVKGQYLAASFAAVTISLLGLMGGGGILWIVGGGLAVGLLYLQYRRAVKTTGAKLSNKTGLPKGS